MSEYGDYAIHCNAVCIDGVPSLIVKYVSVVIGPIMELFLNSPHILYLDACHTTDGTKCALCVFRDMNGKVQPLAFSIFDTESAFSWEGFLECLKKGGLEGQSNLVFVCDHAPAISKAIRIHFEDAEIVLCSAHTERIITNTWEKEYGRITETNEGALCQLNCVISSFNKAMFALTKEEWRENMDAIKEAEKNYRELRNLECEDEEDEDEEDEDEEDEDEDEDEEELEEEEEDSINHKGKKRAKSTYCLYTVICRE